MIIWVAPVLGFLRAALPYALLFLRSLPDLLAPKPDSVAPPYTPPFTGGQCVDGQYRVYVNIQPFGQIPSQTYVTGIGKVQGLFRDIPAPDNGLVVGFLRADGTSEYKRVIIGADTPAQIAYVERLNGTDNCGNLSNPNPPPSISDDGLFNPTNPTIGNDEGDINPAAIIIAPALPLVLVGAIAAGYAAAMAAAKTATDILGGIQKLGEGFEFLKDLFKKLAEDLDEKEKLKPKNRDIVRQTYGQIKGDGAIDFFPDNNTKFEPIQIDIIIVFIPTGHGKYFGSFSPHRYRYKELGYISFYSTNQGILETHSIQFKRSTLQIPPLAIGFIYHFGLDEQIRGFAFGTFSVEKT